jgi:diguanylate cyclase (GGDEF)-like protein/PAS domain S-box-containing protein
MQTHIWPLLRRDGRIRDVALSLCALPSQDVPVLVTCRRGAWDTADCYCWVFVVPRERDLVAEELVQAHAGAEASALALAASERFMRTIADAMPAMVAYWDAEMRCQFANRSYREWFGKSPEELTGQTMREMMGERLFALNEPYIRGALAGERQIFERTLTKADGSIGYTLANYIPDVDPTGAVAGFFVLVSDVTPLKQAEFALRQAASVFHHTIEGIVVTDGDEVILAVNPAFTRITGYAADEVIGQTLRLLQARDQDQAFPAAAWQDLTATGLWEGEIWSRRKDGERFLAWQSISLIRGAGTEPVRCVSIFNDITERWRKDERVRHLAFHDPLTDLPNRHLLLERLDQLIRRAQREQRTVAVLFLDLDGFKYVNDTFGHAIGDDVLMAVAQTLQVQVRQADTVARLGGDEFVILLDNPVSRQEVARIAQHIVESIMEPMTLRGTTVHIGISIGIAWHPTDGAAAVQLLESADAAMYAAKEAGKNTFRFFTSTPTTLPSQERIYLRA